jgi:hypothetical protein
VVAGLVGRKADAFAALLDGSPKAGTQDPALAHLAQLTQRLSSVPQPSPAFKAALRQQLVHAAAHPATAAATATSALHALPRPRVSPGHGAGGAAGTGTSGTSSAIMGIGKSAPLWIKLFTGVTAAAVSATGVGIGAHRALPGDPLYFVKKQVEAVQLDLASGSQDKAKTQLGFAHARLNELNQLIKREHVTPTSKLSSATEGHIRGLLQAWAQDAGVATTSLIEQIRSLGSAASTAKLSAELRQTLATFTTNQFAQLGGLLASVPTGPLQSLTVSALGYLQRVDGVLGGNPASLIQQIPIPLTAIPNLQAVIPQLNLPAGLQSALNSVGSTVLPSKGGVTIPNPLPSGVASVAGKLPKAISSLIIPSAIPTVSVPKLGSGSGSGGGGVKPPSLGGILPSDGGLNGVLNTITGLTGGTGSGGTGSGGTGSGGTGGVGTGGVGGAVNGVGKTVNGVTNNVGSTVSGVTSTVGNAVGGVTGGGSGSTPVTSVVSGATGGTGGVVSSTVATVTGGLASTSGPALPLPTALPTLPPLPKIPGLGG